MPEATHTTAKMMAEGMLLERFALYDRALERYRAAAASHDPAIRARALRRQSDVFRALCQWDAAINHARESAYIAENSGLTEIFTEALNAEATVLATRGELDRALALFRRILALTHTDALRGVVLQNLGTTLAMQCSFAEADALFEQSQECCDRAGFKRGIAAALTNRGAVALEQGDLERARVQFDRALAVAHQLEDLDYIAMATLNSAECHALSDDYRHAEDLASTALGYFTTAGNHWRRIECMRLFGDIRLRQQDARTAERAYRFGLDLARRIGARVEEQVLASRLEELVGAAH